MAAKPTRVIMRGCLVTREGMQARRLIGVVESPSCAQPLGSVVYVKSYSGPVLPTVLIPTSNLFRALTNTYPPYNSKWHSLLSRCFMLPFSHWSLVTLRNTRYKINPSSKTTASPPPPSPSPLTSFFTALLCLPSAFLSQKLSFGSPVITITE